METKKIINIIFLSIALMLVYNFAFSQKEIELQVYTGGGDSQFLYKFRGEKPSIGWGGHAGVSTCIFFNDYLGINVGVEASCYNSKIASEDAISAYMENRYDDYYSSPGNFYSPYTYNLTSTMYNYTEKVNALSINIPIGLQYQTDGEICKFYLIGGLKIGIPIKKATTYEVDNFDIYNTAYYPELDNTFEYNPNNPEATTNHFSGFGYFPNKSFNTPFAMKVVVMPSIETGVKFLLPKTLSLYCGLYCDFGANDIRKYKGIDFIPESNGELLGNDFIPNSLLNAKQNNDKLFANRVSLLSVGIKLRLSFRVYGGNISRYKIKLAENN